MYEWISSLSRQLNFCESEEGRVEVLQSLISSFGFEFFCFSIRSAIPFINPKTRIFGSYPVDWAERYLNIYHARDSELFIKYSKSSLLVIWDHVSMATVDVALSEEAIGHGLRYGCTLKVRDFTNSFLTLSVARPTTAITLSEEQELGIKLRVLIEVFGEYMNIRQDGVSGARETLLTERERQILQWTAEGKSSAEVAMILSICTDTVNYHLNNVKNKLGVTNKTSAVAYGVALGLI